MRGSLPSDRLACLPAAATASSTASRGTNAASTPRETQSVSRPPAATTPLSAISRDHAGHQAQYRGPTRPTTDINFTLSGIASTPANPASVEPLPAQSIMPPLRGPVDSPATLRGFGSYRLRHPSASPSGPGRNDGHQARSAGMDCSPAPQAMRDLRTARDLAITARHQESPPSLPGERVVQGT